MKKVTLQEKMSIKALLAKGKKYPSIAEHLGLGLRVVRKWGQVIKKGECLAPQMGRPKTGALGTFSTTVTSQIDEYRPGKKGWGADTIKVELDLKGDLKPEKKPSASSIKRYLKEKGRTRKRTKHVDPPMLPPAYPVDRPNQIWLLDAEGNTEIKNLGAISMLNIKDNYSKVYVHSYPCPLAGPHNHPTTRDYQKTLRLGMMEFGRPEGLQVDHESVYFDNVNKSPFPTVFHLWLIGLGINMHLTPKGKPQQQGGVERAHQTVHIQVLEGQEFYRWAKLYERCQQRRCRLNYHIPCSSIGNKPPIVVFPQAAQNKRTYDPLLEKKQFKMGAIKNYLAQGQWYRKVSGGKVTWLGSQRYHSPKAVPKSETRITYDGNKNRFLFHDSEDKIFAEHEPKGLTFKELAGDVGGFIKFVKKNPHIIPPKIDTTF